MAIKRRKGRPRARGKWEGGTLLRVARESRGLTQRALARGMGVKQASVCDWEKNRKRPDPSRREALRVLFGVPLEAWLTRSEATASARAIARIGEVRQ